jgi:hypothetical protein
VATLVLALLATLVAPASAGVAGSEPDSTPTRGDHPIRRALSVVPGRVLGLPDTDVALRLRCAPRPVDRVTPAVACEWSGGDDADIRSWQLWRLRVRPEQDGRVLVAEVGRETTSHLDTGVTAPGVHLYAVLGLDGDGEIVGRSRVQRVTLARPAHEVETMRLACAAHNRESDGVATVSVGCDWSEVAAPGAVGYVVWKRTDDGERTVLARVDLSTTAIRDGAVAFGHRYAYLVTAVDRDGLVVARSRVETVAIRRPDRPVDRPVDRPTPEVAALEPTAPEPTVPEPTAPAPTAPEPTVPERPAVAARGDRPASD